jgi:hypothetical protein
MPNKLATSKNFELTMIGSSEHPKSKQNVSGD